MARHLITVESAAALAADTNFANIVAAAASDYELRRVILGVRAGAEVPTSRQITAGGSVFTRRRQSKDYTRQTAKQWPTRGEAEGHG